jgi:hypothetical protein
MLPTLAGHVYVDVLTAAAVSPCRQLISVREGMRPAILLTTLVVIKRLWFSV